MVHKGLEYLVKQQHADGHWEGDGGQHPVAMTGLAGLALLMAAVDPGASEANVFKAKYPAEVRKAADWLMEKCQGERDGLFYSGHASETTRYMEGHGLATLFFAGAFMDERDDVRRKKLNDALSRAIKYILKAQSSRGGWYHTSKVEGHDFDDVLATAIQLQALVAASFTTIPIPNDNPADATHYLRDVLEDEGKEKRPGAETAAALAACYANNREGRTKTNPYKACLKRCQAAIPLGRDLQFGRDELTHYYYAQALFQGGGDVWESYRKVTFDHLQSRQNADGSWPAASGLGVGHVYATALWCTVLQLDRDSHPMLRFRAYDVD
jgi:hypothetical protein